MTQRTASRRAPGRPAPSAGEIDARGRVAWRCLGDRWMWLLVWLPIILFGVGHYATAAAHHWAHDVLRRAYYLPIVLAAFRCGLRGALAASVVTSLTYVPHAFLLHGLHDPAPHVEKVLEIVLYNAIGAVAGHLADLERKRRVQLQAVLQEQQHLQRQLVRAGRLSALGEVVAGIAHEVKNPLHALEGTAEIVDPLIPRDADERRMWELHVAELQRLHRVADRFLSFARPTPPAREPLDLRDVVRRSVDLVSADARRKGVTLETALPEEPTACEGDRDQLAQVILNVAVNAVQALTRAAGGDGGGAEGDVGRVRFTLEAATVEGRPLHALRIENDGPPIPEEDLEHLFDPFHGSGGEGAGLGLSIASRIADQHDGWLEAANTGLGVTFTLYLPAQGGSALTRPRASATVAP